MIVTALRGTAHGASWRHRLVAIGLGWVGLTASKALKHDLANVFDALVFLTRITAQGVARVHIRASLWLQGMATAAAALTIVGVLITLYVAAGRQRLGTSQEHSLQTQKGWC